ncbi:hypothetical protein [Pseudoalteromonas sp. G4]|uniref:hypothetical protein n=1 Tax=Pseudoalteromonas sp. G4 TaxID=2992761 RepID=UPI00237E4553|nr:hypothetical protein [Pseudoalteromonas sp. G4]MDE3273080.1 hypothetical protein [Pseudoalteromonas sp. G4]
MMTNAHALDIAIKVVDKNNTPINDIVVYLTPKSGTSDLPTNNHPLVIDQQDKKFAPYITVMQKGQDIVFLNKDDITHHIYSVSGKNRFEFKLKAGSSKQIENISKTEEVAMGCNIHDWMSGFLLVVNTPYFAKTNTNGLSSISLKNSGEYEISVWHPQLDTPSHKITETHSLNNEKQTITLTLAKPLLPIPKQVGQQEFEFLEEY